MVGARFSATIQTGHEPTRPPIQWILSKAAMAWHYHPPPSSNKVKERVALYFCSCWYLHGRLEGEIYLYSIIDKHKHMHFFIFNTVLV